MGHFTLINSDFCLLQHLDYAEVETERPGELIAYYKIARMVIFSLLCVWQLNFKSCVNLVFVL